MLNPWRLLAVSAALLSLSVAGAPPAHADAQAVCVGQGASNAGCSSATVTITVSVNGSATTLSAGGAPVCTDNGVTIPCGLSSGAWWSSSRGCYVSKASPQPPQTDSVWEGHTDGAIYQCMTFANGTGAPVNSLFWSGSAPVSTAQVAQLAAEATSSLNLQGITVGMAPEPTSINPASIGIVGLPNWMWAKAPSAQTWGPASASRSSGGLTVNVVARAQTVTWDMGDGSAPIVCTGPGTPYSASYGKAPSPTCGYSGYTRQGTYPVSALTHWVVAYTSNVGIDGTLVLDLTSTASVTIGELQTTVG